MIIDDCRLMYEVNGKMIGAAYQNKQLEDPRAKPFVCMSETDVVEVLRGSG